MPRPVRPSRRLDLVTYDIRGPLSRRARELEAEGRQILRLNIGNPGAFGFRVPDVLREAVQRGVADSEAYCHQQGLPTARAAIAERERRLDANTHARLHQFEHRFNHRNAEHACGSRVSAEYELTHSFPLKRRRIADDKRLIQQILAVHIFFGRQGVATGHDQDQLISKQGDLHKPAAHGASHREYQVKLSTCQGRTWVTHGVSREHQVDLGMLRHQRR